jgi:transcriptional regulator with XRE-family HTH domain
MTPNNIEIGNRIKGIMSIKNITREKLSELMHTSYNTLTKKLNGKREFGISDMHKLKDILELDVESCGNIFFNDEFLVKKQK